jgi:hypothetical protein
VAAGAALAFALPGGTAVAVQSQSPPVSQLKLGNTATLDANGAVVFAPVSIVCRPGSDVYVSVSVTENVGGDIAKGTASEEIEACTGKVQRVEIAVTPDLKAFRLGVAFGQARVSVCDTRCRTITDQHNVQIVNRH